MREREKREREMHTHMQCMHICTCAHTSSCTAYKHVTHTPHKPHTHTCRQTHMRAQTRTHRHTQTHTHTHTDTHRHIAVAHQTDIHTCRHAQTVKRTDHCKAKARRCKNVFLFAFQIFVVEPNWRVHKDNRNPIGIVLSLFIYYLNQENPIPIGSSCCLFFLVRCVPIAMDLLIGTK
jgi:hypothetical protein